MDEDTIRNFIDTINATYSRQWNNGEIDKDYGLALTEAAINYSFSDVDTAFASQTDSNTFDFELDLNGNGKFDYLELSNKIKSVTNYIKSITNANTRMLISDISYSSANNYSIKVTVGELDPDFDYDAAFTAPTVSGYYLWRNRLINGYNNITLRCDEINDKPEAPKIIHDKGDAYLVQIRNSRTKDISMACPFGWEVYYDLSETVRVAGAFKFYQEDVNTLSRFDWSSSFLSECDAQSNCSTKSHEPYQSAIYAADPDLVACMVQFSPIELGHKSCLNAAAMNYYIKKTADIYDFLVSFDATHLNLYNDITVGWQEQTYTTDPIQHFYSFSKLKARYRYILTTKLQ